jgi:hypothetical protein
MKRYFLLLVGITSLLMACDKDSANTASSVAPVTGAGGSTARFAIVGNFLYSVDHQNLRVFNISSPTNPIEEASLPVGFEIETIYPFKDKLFIGSTTVVHIFSISNPAKPVKLSEAISPDVIRRCDPVVAKDSFAFATLRTNGLCGGNRSILAVFNIQNIQSPVQIASMQLTEPYGLGYADTVLYVCDKGGAGLKLFGIHNPRTPKPINVSLQAADYKDVIVYNNVLICFTETGTILYDITQPATPIYLSKII